MHKILNNKLSRAYTENMIENAVLGLGNIMPLQLLLSIPNRIFEIKQ